MHNSLNEKSASFKNIEGLSVIQKAEQYDMLMDLIRMKIAISFNDKKIQLLTLGHGCSNGGPRIIRLFSIKYTLQMHQCFVV